MIQSLVSLLCNISTFFSFLKTGSNFSPKCEISDKNRKKFDESWTCPTFLQLNGRDENCSIF